MNADIADFEAVDEDLPHYEQPVCHYFGTAEGCRNGDKCPFKHNDPKAKQTPPVLTDKRAFPLPAITVTSLKKKTS